MSLKNKFKTDSAAVAEGVWVEFEANEDGTIPGFKLGFASKQNKEYTKAMRKLSANYTDEMGVVSFDSLPEEQAEKLVLEVFADTILKDWRNIQPEDNGVELPFTRENAIALLGSPDWQALYDVLTAKSKKITNFQQRSLVAQAKN